MKAFLAYLEAGIVSGAIYSLIGIGMNLLLVVSNVILFAYGEIVVISMYMCWLTLKYTGSYVLAFTMPLFTAVVLSLLVEPLLRRLRERRLRTETLVITIAVGLVLTEIMAGFLNRGLPIAFPASTVGGGWEINYGLIRITGADTYVVIAAVTLMGSLLLFLFRTKHGKGLRAIAHNIEAARLLGIPLRKEVSLSFFIAGLLAGVTAILLIITIGVATPELGELVTFKGMAVMMLGGMGSLKGAVVGGLLLGIIECMVRGYFLGDWVDAIAMGCIMVVIICRPGGLFGESHAEN